MKRYSCLQAGLLLMFAGGLAWSADLPYPVNDWAYQLQGYDRQLNSIRNSRFDLVVMDYSFYGDAESEFTVEQISSLRRSGPCGGRIVLAYMSIGEAETYRFYFHPDWIDADGNPATGTAPAFLGPPNPDWSGSYKVKYWLGSWKRILYGMRTGPDKSYLDRIIDQGFDGVYLDIIDGFEYWGPEEIGGNNVNRHAAGSMITLVRQIAAYARNKRGRKDFLVFPQNGAAVIVPEAFPCAANPDREAQRQKQRYFKVINGIGAEDTFFFGDRDNNNPYRPQNDTIGFLNQFADAGKLVLAVDYLTTPGKISTFYSKARERGYVPYATKRELDRLTVPRDFPPDCHP
jgi:cysteinyl-tRNA synthetase